VVITVPVVVSVRNPVMVTVVVAITVVMGHVMMTIRMAALLLHLSRRNIAVAPTLFLSLVPACGTLVIVTIVVAIAVMIAVGVAVFVMVLFFVATMAVAVSAFCKRTRGQGETKHHGQKQSIELGSHWELSYQLESKLYAV
jgi:hypothetical protein